MTGQGRRSCLELNPSRAARDTSLIGHLNSLFFRNRELSANHLKYRRVITLENGPISAIMAHIPC